MRDLAITNLELPENGYLYVYVSNESARDVSFDNLQIGHYTTHLNEVNDYYPFGLLVNNSFTYGQTPQNYKYNGKELQKDLAFNVEDYGARDYDPVIGRWLQVDPLAENYRRFSPYNYGVDNPIRFIDPDGNGIGDVIVGTLIGVVTDIIPFTSELRDVYEPDDPADYNDALQSTDATMTAVGSTMVKGGAGAAATGAVVIENAAAAELVSVGTATPGAVPAAIVGGALVVAGTGTALQGALLMSNSSSNAAQGYDRGKKENRRSGEEHTSNARKTNEEKHQKGQARNAKAQAKADERYANTKSTKSKETKSKNQQRREDPNYKRLGPKRK